MRGRPSAGVYAWTIRLVRYQAHVYAYVYLVADPYPSFRGWAGTYPVDVAIAPPGPQARWKTLLPHRARAPRLRARDACSSTCCYIVAFLGAFFALATGRFPRGFRDLSAYCLRYQAQTCALSAAPHRPLPDARKRLEPRSEPARRDEPERAERRGERQRHEHDADDE